MLLTFFVPSLPVAQPRQRHTRTGHNYTPSTHPVQAFKYAVAQEARRLLQQGGLPSPCFPEGGVSLAYTLYFPRPKALQWKRRPQMALYHWHKPDMENVQMGLQNALTGIVWHDDAQIAVVTGRKLICGTDDQVGVLCVIEALPEGPGLTH